MYRVLFVVFLLVSLVPVGGRAAQPASERASVMFLFDENVSEADEYLIRESIRFAQDYFIDAFGTDVSRSIVVNVKSDPDESANYARDYQIHLNSLTFLGYPPLIRTSFIVHEYFHLWQEDASGRQFATPSQVHPFGPQWLIEGSAEYIGSQSLTSTGIVSFEEIRERTIQMANGAHSYGPPTLPAIRSLATHHDMIEPNAACCAYSLSAIAIEFLADVEGPRAIGEYFQTLGETGKPWQSVFKDTFGMSVDDFYSSFEEQRPSLLSSGTGLDVTQLLRTPSYNEVPADFSLSLAPESIEPGKQAVFYGWSENGSTCDMTVGIAASDNSTTYSTFGDAYGLVVWFWSVPETLDAESLAFDFGCGAAPISIEIDVE